MSDAIAKALPTRTCRTSKQVGFARVGKLLRYFTKWHANLGVGTALISRAGAAFGVHGCASRNLIRGLFRGS